MFHDIEQYSNVFDVLQRKQPRLKLPLVSENLALGLGITTVERKQVVEIL